MLDRPDSGERALLVNVGIGKPVSTLDSLEFKELALSAGAEIVDSIEVVRQEADVKYLIGTGKIEEIVNIINTHDVELVIFNWQLSAPQERNLENKLKTRVIDKTGLILDIFAQRARTFEGKLQVELAQLEHLSTRLIRGWTHLERQKGGIGLRGPGETQLEIDRRLIRERIKYIKSRLLKVSKQRSNSRRARNKSSIPTIALVGYTNAGKSTLFNKITEANVLSENKLFATLDTTLRHKVLSKVGKVIFSDTVGFIKDLPHELIDAFKATLEEATSADLLLHVIDYRDEYRNLRKIEVENILKELKADKIPTINVYNKIDLLDMDAKVEEDDDKSVWLSSQTGEGIDLLFNSISSALGNNLVSGVLNLPSKFAKTRADLYEVGAVLEDSSSEEGWQLEISLPKYKWNMICKNNQEITEYLS